MASERKIRRYAAYFHGWATAFGHHDKHIDEQQDLSWLLGKDQVGLVLTPGVKEFLGGLFPTNHAAEPPGVELSPGRLRIADAAIRFDTRDQPGFDSAMALLQGAGDLHLLQTYHVIYPRGTRILTLSRHSPLTLIYREIKPLMLRLV